jgi:hypothetical protein
MTPQEKAKELVDKMYGVTDYQAKQSALIAVDEIIKILSEDINPLVNYWHEVKKEIEKL